MYLITFARYKWSVVVDAIGGIDDLAQCDAGEVAPDAAGAPTVAAVAVRQAYSQLRRQVYSVANHSVLLMTRGDLLFHIPQEYARKW